VVGPEEDLVVAEADPDHALGLLEQAAQELGVRADFVGPTEADASLQVQKIEALLQTGIDGIGIAPNVPESVVDVIARARDMGIPVICFDSDSPESERLCYVGTFNESAGYEAGKLMKTFMPEGGKILVVSGGAGALNHQERIAGFERGIEDGDLIKVFNERGHFKSRVNVTEGITPGALNLIQGWWPEHFVVYGGQPGSGWDLLHRLLGGLRRQCPS